MHFCKLLIRTLPADATVIEKTRYVKYIYPIYRTITIRYSYIEAKVFEKTIF